MTRSEWLETMRDALVAELPQSEIDNNIGYYKEYIERESINRDTEDVMAELGDPRLIAKTIIETYKMQRGASGYNAYGDNVQYDYSDLYERNKSSYSDTVDEEGNASNDHIHSFQIKEIKWYHKAIFYAILALIIVIVIFIGGVLLRVFFTIGLPILLVLWVIQMFRNR